MPLALEVRVAADRLSHFSDADPGTGGAAWYRELVRHSSDVITALTPEGEIRYENPALTRELGWEPDELVGTDSLELVHPDDRERVAEALAEVAGAPAGSGAVTVELRFRHADGRWIPFESRALPPAEFGSELVVVLSRNVSERREAKRALERSVDKYETFFEMVPVGVVLSDPDTGLMYEVNERFQEIFGYPREELVGRRAPELGLWEDPDRRSELVRRVREDGGFKGEDAWHVRRDGQRLRTILSCRRLELAGEDRILWTVEDVSEQWRKEEELHLQRDALEATDQAILITDREGEIVWLNPAFTELSGYSADEALGRTPRILNSGHHDPAFFREMWDTILGGETWSGEVVNRRKDGTPYTEWESIVPVRHRSDGITHFIALKRDVTEEREREAALRRSEERYRALFENSVDPVALTTPGGEFLDVNRAFEEHFGYSREELSERTVRDLYADAAEREALIQVLRSVGEVQDYEVELVTADGEARTCRISGRVQRGPNGEHRFIQSVLHDITELKRLEQQLRHRALHDPLTDLGNRALLQERLPRAVAQAGRSEHWMALAILDFDRFKRVNDSLGHTAGDRLLTEAAARLREATRDEETIVRLGGDEFAILLEELGSEDDARAALNRVSSAVNREYGVGGTTVRLEGSIGVALYRPDGELDVKEPGDLLRYADMALHEAKGWEDRRVVFYRPGAAEDRTTVVAREHELNRAIESGALACHYQPIFELEGGRIHGFEALARWPQQDGTVRAPEEFIGLAEESGLIVPMGYALLEEACERLTAWDAAGIVGEGAPPKLFVNVSPRQLAEEDTVERFGKILEAAGLAPERLVVELTENAVVRRPEQVDRLTARGVGLAIDDFGTGYASLAYLKLMDVDLLKIDRSFVDGLGSQREDTAIVEAVQGLAASFGIDAVAEGVETKLQLLRLRELGCRYAQGFHLARPAPADQMEALLSEG